MASSSCCSDPAEVPLTGHLDYQGRIHFHVTVLGTIPIGGHSHHASAAAMRMQKIQCS
jgi:hypothetical protein